MLFMKSEKIFVAKKYGFCPRAFAVRVRVTKNTKTCFLWVSFGFKKEELEPGVARTVLITLVRGVILIENNNSIKINLVGEKGVRNLFCELKGS